MTSVHSRPPTRSRASSTATDSPAFFSSFAAVSAGGAGADDDDVPRDLGHSDSFVLAMLAVANRRCARAIPVLAPERCSATGGSARISRARERGGDDVEALVEQVVGDRQRREEADHVPVGAAREHDDALRDARLRDRGGERGIRLPRRGVDELGGDHGAVAAHVADARVGRLQLRAGGP